MAVKFLNDVAVDSSVLYVDTTNNRVGIGTTSPGSALAVNGEIDASGGDGYRIETKPFANWASDVLTLGDWDGEGYSTRIMGSNSSEVMRVTGNNVGIGTTAPSQKLHVNGSALVSSALYVGSTSASIYSYFNSLIIQNTASTSVNIGGGPGSVANNLYVSNGSIGIGTTSPSEKLHVYNGTSYVTPIAYAANQSAYALKVGAYNSASFDMGLQAKSTSGGSPYMSFRTTSTDNVLTIWGDKVGIKTTPNLSYNLDINGTLRTVGDSYFDDDIHLGRYIFHAGDTNTWIGFPSNDTITLRTNNSDRVRVASTGYVGINETNPTARLQVAESSITTFTGTGSSAQLRLRGGYTANEYIILGFSQDSSKDIGRMAVKRGGSGSSFHWGVSTNYGNGVTNEAMILNHQGRLGINNLTPSYLLDVGGDGRVNGTLTCVTLVQTSQRDQKKDIADIDKTKAKAIPFKEYKYKSSIDGSERKRYGVVAEDIENDYPELVHTGADGVKGINYIDLLVKRVAELEKELEDISLTPGPKGDKGDTGAQGPAGANGTNGKNGNSHLSNVSSIALNEKTGQLEVTIGKTTLRFNPAK